MDSHKPFGLHFGTAGLRGTVGDGDDQMNVANVKRATAGLAAYLGPDSRVVVGCDARHGSAEFYDAALKVLSGAGVHAIGLTPKRPTPVTAFAVKFLQADAGIMITASHNPPEYNGYKVYLSDGIQIVPPADADIAAAIETAPVDPPLSTDLIERCDVTDEFIAAAVGMCQTADANAKAGLKIVVTPMHGVGGATLVSALKRAGFGDVVCVDKQMEPDPDFPTVRFPNPEEPGALDLALELAEEAGADLVIAADPDADRLAVAADGEQLTGDETGLLLGHYLAQKGLTGSLANSIVSGRALGKVAEKFGLDHYETLTGFKWIARASKLGFGYEEAIGFCCDPAHVSDKDGISAAIVFASLTAELKARGVTVHDHLRSVRTEFGGYTTAPLTFRVTDTSLIAQAMDHIRATPPTSLAGSPVVRVVDLTDHEPPTDGVMFFTEADDRVVIRPSGTEPKLKYYLEVAGDPTRIDQLKNDVARATGMEK
ncbi:phospho-sugar mutase [Corynebacterium pyruviciproducens]